MVNEKILAIWKRKAQEGDSEAQERLRNMSENTEVLTGQCPKLYNNIGYNKIKSDNPNRKENRITIRLDDSLLQIIIREASLNKIKVSKLIRNAVESYLASKEVEGKKEDVSDTF